MKEKCLAILNKYVSFYLAGNENENNLQVIKGMIWISYDLDLIDIDQLNEFCEKLGTEFDLGEQNEDCEGGENE